MQPGDMITPGQQPPETSSVPAPNPAVSETAAPPAPTTQSAAPVAPTPATQPIAPPVSQQTPPVPMFEQTIQPHSDKSTVNWTASEYIDHAKSPAWFAMAGIGIVVLSIVVYFLLKDIVTPVLLAIAGMTVAVFAGRKPRVVQYAISPSGIQIDQRLHGFNDFKSFALTESGPLPAILLTPLKRFLPPITIFYDPKEEDTIIDALADYLPYEDKEPDAVDRFMSRIRF